MTARHAALVLLLAVGASEAQDRPLRALRIRGAHATQRTRQGELEGMAVTVAVETDGFEGAEVGAEVRLAAPDGKPIRVPRGTPPRYRDERGAVRVAEVQRVAGDRACETSFELFIPYGGIVPPGRRERRVVVLVAVRCGGLSGLAAFGGFLPPMRPPPTVPGLRIDDVTLAQEKDGFGVSLRLDTGSLLRGEIRAGIRLRAPDGRAVRVRAEAPPELTGPRGMLDCRGRWAMDPAGAGAVPVRLFVPYEVLDLAAGQEHSLALTSFAEVGAWRALREQEIRIRIGEGIGQDRTPPDGHEEPPDRDDPPRPQPGPGDPPRVEVEVVHPSPEELSGPYRGLAGSHGLDSNLLRLEAKATGLPAGPCCLQLDLGAAGRRCVWARVDAKTGAADFSAAVPVPCGSFRATLFLPGLEGREAATLEGEMAPHAWAPSRAELEEWRGALEEWRQRVGDDSDTSGLVLGTLLRMAGGYLLRGDYDRAEETCRECLALCTEGEDGAEPRREVDRIRLALHLLRGELAALDAVCRDGIARERQADRRAALYREWAERRAILDPDPSRARELWRKAEEEAGEAGAETPTPPPWLG